MSVSIYTSSFKRWAKDYLRRRLDWVVEDRYGEQVSFKHSHILRMMCLNGTKARYFSLRHKIIFLTCRTMQATPVRDILKVPFVRVRWASIPFSQFSQIATSKYWSSEDDFDNISFSTLRSTWRTNGSANHWTLVQTQPTPVAGATDP